MPQRVRFIGQRLANIETFDLPPLQSDQVRIQSLFSLMSTGTEGIVYARLFDPGTHWDNWVKYPFYPGYSLIGEIIEVGEGVKDRQPGQRVAVRAGHASHVTVKAAATHLVPDGIDARDATWFALAKIASHGARVAQHWIGQTVAIVGAGPIGQMALRWAAASGVTKLAMVDPVQWRLDLARAGGASHTVCEPVEKAKDAVWQAIAPDIGPDVVIEVTGHPAVFAPTLGLPRRLGRVVLLGDAGRPAEQRLTPDVVTRGVQIAGVHDMHEDDQWNSAKAIPSFFSLHRQGRFPLDGLISHTFTPSQAAEAYELAATRRSETMGIVFDWSQDHS